MGSKKNKRKDNLNWISKLIDLLIVIIGITIAFQLNNLRESNKSVAKEKEYIKSFYDESKDNESYLSSALNFSISNKNDIDTLKQILLSGRYYDKRIKVLTASMLGMENFNPSITTMENITASGEFELLKDIELRKRIINTYDFYNTTLELENLLTDYVNKYVTPVWFNHIRLSNMSYIDSTFIQGPLFENVVFGYEVLLNQQIKGYQENLERVKHLNKILAIANEEQ
ncbi:hypothetical protein JKA74_03790 [Marivirga sp. S37H4]|uniref:Uncharacterized protein n=1 Tax=Marivirga aurantiaca TaxID=2802615 RepID=A0A935C9A5_9BACT|nr:hypothetical protein [Marivirga aurantiaca]MBK6264148.1 hypothetical protein [Marivirga aurantiaca]